MVIVQALRAEVESRRVLLANQELSLRERELALEARESESGAASATARLAAAAAAAAAEAELRKRQQQEEADKDRRGAEVAEARQLAARPPPVEKFWPATSAQDVETAESSDGVDFGATTNQQEGPAQEATPHKEAGSGKDASGQLPIHWFRCVSVCF